MTTRSGAASRPLPRGPGRRSLGQQLAAAAWRNRVAIFVLVGTAVFIVAGAAIGYTILSRALHA